jgi:hypothetical protein
MQISFSEILLICGYGTHRYGAPAIYIEHLTFNVSDSQAYLQTFHYWHMIPWLPTLYYQPQPLFWTPTHMAKISDISTWMSMNIQWISLGYWSTNCLHHLTSLLLSLTTQQSALHMVYPRLDFPRSGLTWRSACRKLIGGFPGDQHLWRSEGSKAGQRVKLNSETIIIRASVDSWGALALELNGALYPIIVQSLDVNVGYP